jgi:hypothetical protein
LRRTLLTGTEHPIFKHARLEKSVDDPQKPWVRYPVSEKPLQMGVCDVIKETFDVRLHNPLRVLHRDDLR